MGKLVRKNLMLDADQLRELARRKGTNESETVRDLIKHALTAEEVIDVFRELHARGGIDDVFGKLEIDAEIERGERATRARSQPQARTGRRSRAATAGVPARSAS